MNRFLRFMICLVVICAMVVQISPIQVAAAGPWVLVPAGIAIGAALVGLGFGIGQSTLEHNHLVQDFVTILDYQLGLISDGMIEVLSLGNGRYGVHSELLDLIRDILQYKSGAIDYFFSGMQLVPTGAKLMFSGYTATVNSPCYAFGISYRHSMYGDYYTYLYFVGNGVGVRPDVYVNSSSYGAVHQASNGYYYMECRGDEDKIKALNVPFTDASTQILEVDDIIANATSSGSFIPNGDFTLNNYVDASISLADGYPAWHANAVFFTDDDGSTFYAYPIAMGNSYEETVTIPQVDIWTGNGTYVDSESVPGTGDGTITVPDNATLKDILTGVLTIPQAISIAASNVVAAVQAIPAAIQAIPAAIADFFSFKPPPDHNQFALVDLKDFFPFCIPFDLYAFFQLLDADPVAPVLSWEIPDLSGQVYSLSIDLAEWDSVALLFRRLQLFLFITGLAAASRKFIKW